LKGSIALKIGNRKMWHINRLAPHISIILGIFYRHSWQEKQGDPDVAAADVAEGGCGGVTGRRRVKSGFDQAVADGDQGELGLIRDAQFLLDVV
jgi:hypothetical protein